MEVLATVLQGTLAPNNDLRNQAEAKLYELQRVPGFLGAVCNVVATAPDQGVRLAACVALNNAVTRNWTRTADKVKGKQDTVFPDADKAVVKTNIVELAMGIAEKAILKTLSVTIAHICFKDFPDHWDGLVPALEANLKRVSELQRIHNVLLIVRKISKKYELCMRAKWGPMILISDRLMPLLLQLLQTLLPSHVEQAAIFIKYIAKIVYSVTVYQVANFTQDEATVVAWFTALEQVLARPLYEPGTGKQPEQPADVLERDDWVWWKCKRRVARVFDTVMEKFGNLSSIPASNTEDRAFSAHFRKHVVARVFPQVMNMVAARFKDNVFVADKCLAHLISFLQGCVRTKAHALLKPYIPFLVQNVIAPMCSFTDEDQELWVSDPHEFVRVKYNPQRDPTDPRNACEELLSAMVSTRPKATMKLLEAYWQEVMKLHAATPNHRLKDGALAMFGVIKPALETTNYFTYWESKIEPFLLAAALPEFDAPPHAPYLKARACWVYSQYADSIDFQNDKMLGVAAAKIVACLDAKETLPVQFTAAASLWFVAQSDSPSVGHVMAANITTLVGHLLRIMNEVPVDDVVSSLDAIISKFGDGIIPHAVGLVEKLIGLWRTFAEDGEAGDDEAALSAEHCLQCVGSLLPLAEGRPDMFEPMCTMLMPVLSLAFDTTAKRSEQLENATHLLYLLARYSPTPFKPVMWHALRAMVQAFFGFADDYIAHIVGPLGYFIARDTETFVTGSAGGVTHLALVAKIVTHIVSGRKGSENERRDAMPLLYMVLHQCHGRVDDFMGGALTIATTELRTCRTEDYKVQLAVVVLSAFIYNARLAIARLSAAGSLEDVMASLFAIMPTMVSRMQHKVGLLGLCAMLCVPVAELPPVLSSNMSALLGLAISMLDFLASDGSKANSGGGAGGGDYDGFGDEDDLGDDEDFADGAEGAFQAALARVSNSAAAVRKAIDAGEALPEGFDPEDYVDDDDEGWGYEEDEEDEEYVSPLDDMDAFAVFKSTVQALGASPGGVAIHNRLTAEQKKQCQSHMARADAGGEKAVPAEAGASSGAGSGAGAGAR